MNMDDYNRSFAIAMLAGQDGSNLSISQMLQRPGIDVNSLFHVATALNNVDKMAELVHNHGANVNQTTKSEVCNMAGQIETVSQTPLVEAVMENCVASVKWLLENGANVNKRQKSPTTSIPPIWYAAQSGNVRIVHLLLSAGADIDAAKVPTNTTPLMIAVQNGHQAVASLLIRKGANVHKSSNMASNGGIATSIMLAIYTCRTNLVAQFIHRGGSVLPPMNPQMFEFLGLKDIIDNMRRTKRTSTDLNQREVSDDDLNELTELLIEDKEPLQSESDYQKARKAEYAGEFRTALKYLRGLPSSCDCLQLKMDIQRNFEAVYGVKGSDARISIWNQVPTSRKQPKNLQWFASAQLGRKLYVHGGVNFITHQDFPDIDEIWSLDIDTRKWIKIQTTGDSPGPRTGHSMFVHNGDIYFWGGRGPRETKFSDSSKFVHRFRAQAGSDTRGMWERLKTKGLAPKQREEHAGCYYRKNFYITGGGQFGEVSDDFWSLDMSSMKWNCLKPGPVKRKAHKMWGANGKLYVLGGTTVDGIEMGFIPKEKALGDFHSYDISSNLWKTVKIYGDSPFEISEFTVLPLQIEGNDEPSSVLIFGGYEEIGQHAHSVDEDAHKRKYGEEYIDFRIPYRKRLLRFSPETEIFTLLKPTIDLLPKAQSIAAHISTTNGTTKVLIGRGYGFTHESVNNGSAQGYSTKPEASENIYEVSIVDDRDICCTKDNLEGSNWAWQLFDLPAARLPSFNITAYSPASATFFVALDFTAEDFSEPPTTSIRPNDESTLLGVRVELQGLKGRKDLNESKGRCCRWKSDNERYTIFIPSYEKGGPCMVSVKPLNLSIAKPLQKESISTALGQGTGTTTSRAISKRFPCVLFFLCSEMGCSSAMDSVFKNPLDCLFDEPKSKKVSLTNDRYCGPVSSAAQAVLRSLADLNPLAQSDSCMTISLTYPSLDADMSKLRTDSAYFLKFYERLKEKDSIRVKEFESRVLKDGKKNISIGDWLKVVVTLDGIHPRVRRELIVSMDFNLQNFHHQVLCPSIGWTSNYHSYAFRRIYRNLDFNRGVETNLSSNDFSKSLKMMGEECWIGPSTSTAIDAMFQPLYIGGALADDEKVTLRDLFRPTKDGTMYMQYVSDLGDWWSHTLEISKIDNDQVPENVAVAHLVSGTGAAPPEDIGGTMGYCNIIKQLSGAPDHDEDGKQVDQLDPSSAEWWDKVNGDIRSKRNWTNLKLLDFDIDEARLKLDLAIRRPTEIVGEERMKMTQTSISTGLTSAGNRLGSRTTTDVKKKDRRKFCAVCGITVALKICSRCSSVAYCCRDHQVQHWSEHKAECKKVQKM